MGENQIITERIRQAIANNLKGYDPNTQIKLLRSSLGWIQLQVLSRAFTDLSDQEREKMVDQALATVDLHLGMYPFSRYELLAPDEASEQFPYEVTQLPLWSEVLLAPEPDVPVEEQVENRTPLVVTFYSFKGGVGRTTALAITAGLLAEAGRRVAMVDFDLEAPGLSVMLQSVEREDTKYGVLDYIYQRWLTPEEDVPSIADCIRRVGHGGSDLFLVPAGAYDENYIHRLADFDVEKYYRREPNPVRQLVKDISDYLNPDVILVDARTGFDETSAVALFDLADLAIVCFAPNEQNYRGLKWVIKAIYKQKQSHGKPDLRFVLTPMPSVAQEKREEWLVATDDLIADLWGVDADTSAEELRAVIDYQPAITVVKQILQDVREDLQQSYRPIAGFIDAALPDLAKGFSVAGIKGKILGEFSFEDITADQINSEDIPDIFQRTGDFPKFLSERTSLIRGAKGTGKSLLFRLFVEQSVRAKELSRPQMNLDRVQFIGAHGRSNLDNLILASDDFETFEAQAGQERWQSLWRAYALLRLAYKIPSIPVPDVELHQELDRLVTVPSIPHRDIVDWLVRAAQISERGTVISDTFRAINRWLDTEKQQIWLLYDELDVGFGSSKESHSRRRRALEALLSWWLEFGDTLSNVKMKSFIREDIWREINFPNKSHYTGHDLVLRWQEEDLWRLVLRRALNAPTFAERMFNAFGLDKNRLEQMDVDSLRRFLHPLWGERMGRGRKAYTHRWVLRRIADARENRFPRSLILLMAKAVENEKTQGSPQQDILLRPRSLQDALLYVSQKRVEEVRDEYHELESALDELKGNPSPLSRETLVELWKRLETNPEDLIEKLLQAGILERRPAEGEDTPRYAVAELYLSGLGMRRKGQR
jgi:MinD-like ATPase involved in chromosome partitioning or flagellar assembly